ncbi:hypothetical protein PM082_009652 [Marasmius tenuissimus]|nr:hypothetical protein PM082_009652 [Marasmius tenuissimus]
MRVLNDAENGVVVAHVNSLVHTTPALHAYHTTSQSSMAGLLTPDGTTGTTAWFGKDSVAPTDLPTSSPPNGLKAKQRRPWMGERVVIRSGAHRNKTGVIRGVSISSQGTSGLSLALELDTQRFSGARSSDVYVDYNDVRHHSTQRFLNEVLPRIFSHRKDHEDDFQFKSGYIPRYTEVEERQFKLRQREAALAFQTPTTVIQNPGAYPIASGGQTPLPDPSARQSDRSVWDAGIAERPPTPEWILVPLTLTTLGDLRVLVNILNEGEDQWVRLRAGKDGGVEIRQFGYRITKWDSARRVGGSQIQPSTKLPSPKSELSMMLVTEGEHIGKIVYRVGQRFLRAQDESSIVMIVAAVTVHGNDLWLSS